MVLKARSTAYIRVGLGGSAVWAKQTSNNTGLTTSTGIDKLSSAELSEAINSMFRWYQQAGICYAYLSDVEASPNWDNVINSSF
jgi:hypothetical protein